MRPVRYASVSDSSSLMKEGPSRYRLIMSSCRWKDRVRRAIRWRALLPAVLSLVPFGLSRSFTSSIARWRRPTRPEGITKRLSTVCREFAGVGPLHATLFISWKVESKIYSGILVAETVGV
ncbi:hypothetical protein NEOLEDRAFT_690769 [Neolentinus lepideus HHB14362 ss-1]|uniref:Uncharacterized protein n=1 Tax=Neolentinus lepideus HHB14362 ss-1 TaxID=1314782 RepID=A0A165V1E0_9AGAM|nr:hypothetical protein NEOLEDRAFT_690769 [Neolentinus lepideus HHB14362 ss-1]